MICYEIFRSSYPISLISDFNPNFQEKTSHFIKEFLNYSLNLLQVYDVLWEYSKRVGLILHNRRLLTFCSWHTGISQILITSHLQSNKDVLRVCIYRCGVSTSTAYGVGFVLLVLDLWAMREPL